MVLERLDTVIAFAVIMLGISLLITILTQMASSFFGLRGTNLLWGIKTVLKTADPRLEARANALARSILTHPIISDSAFSRFERVPLLRRWRLATAIRPEELVRVLSAIAGANWPDAETADIINEMLGTSDPGTQRKIAMVHDAFSQMSPQWTGKIDEAMRDVTASARQSVGRVETWFVTAMDRVSQRFALHMRLWTIAFAFAVAVGAHLDSFLLLKQLATSPDERSALVNMRDAMLKEAQVFTPPQGASGPAGGHSTGPTIAPAVLNEAMAELRKRPDGKGLPESPASGFSTYSDATTFLNQHGQPQLVPMYERLVMQVLKDHFDDINGQLVQGGFQLIPRPYPWPWYQGIRNLAGILVTASLLSLGAPFWFNALKSLSNLRPIVAEHEKKESGTEA